MLTLEQRIYLIQCYGTGEGCYRNVGAKKLVTKFLETGSVLDIKKSKKLLNEDDAASVLALHSVREAPRLSLRRRAIETDCEITKVNVWPVFLDINLTGEIYLEMLQNTIESLNLEILDDNLDESGNMEITFQQYGALTLYYGAIEWTTRSDIMASLVTGPHTFRCFSVGVS
ncbi:hypothetical protein NQ318_014902 [Aromia moschata]|uniref:Uncharacterized protein n=1 Tax=Aromia moschata TaxID=1265417 RepID=A0AAV8YUY0_9CUCU|nr:hypothetical protein NQ318_014902 [Aromia moschata]